WTDHLATNNSSNAITLVAGTKYDIALEFYEHTGAAKCVLKWAYPGQAQQVVPSVRLYPASSSTGLKGEYFDTSSFNLLKLTRVDATVNFDWGTGSPAASI